MPSSGQSSGRRLSDAEALMWSLEAEPALRSAFIGVTFLDRTPDFERFRRRVADAAATVAALNHRVTTTPFDFLVPHWEPDPDFDLDFHLRRATVPAPGSVRQLLDLAAAVCEEPMDRSRPLWQFTVVEGLADGGAALLAKMDHVLSDGVGAIRLSTSFLDLTPDGAVADRHPERPQSATDDTAPDEPAHNGGPRGTVPALVSFTASVLAANAGLAKRAATGIVDTVRQPQHLPGQAVDAVTLARSLARQLAVVDRAHSPLWSGRRTLRHRFEVLSVDLDTVRAIAHKLGGTVNDVFVTAVAGAAGAYHDDRGAPVAELRMSMPVSTRHDHAVGGNAWAPTRVLVPTGESSPLIRFSLVHERLERLKREPSLGLSGPLAGLARTIPTPLRVRLARQQVGTVDFACSNVRGAPFDLWIGGALVRANHPMGPTGGTAFNATVLSYKDSFDIGLNVDVGAVDDPAELRQRMVEAFAELAAAAGV